MSRRRTIKLAAPSALATFVLTCWFALTPSTREALATDAKAVHPQGVGQNVAHWTKLVPTEIVGIENSVPIFKLKTENGSTAYLAVADINGGLQLQPFFNASTATTSSALRLNDALVAVNGGFFNLKDAESTSYVVIDGKNQCEPKTNKSLVNNPKLKAYLPAIFNRSELRVLKDSRGKTRLEISKHDEPIPAGWRLESSLQAGPQLLPELTDQQEAFIRTNPDGTTSDSIGSRRAAARTACGITADGHVLLLCVASAGQQEFSSGVRLVELAQILKQLGCVSALNLDGGTSTTMCVANQAEPSGPHAGDSTTTRVLVDKLLAKLLVGSSPEKRVKSGLMIKAIR